MENRILGARVRELRRQAGLSQAELARRLEISPSYLNLIEHNKRRIAGALLRRTAAALDVAVDDLDGAGERRLVEALNEAARSPALRDLGVELHALGELVGRYPGWARALAALVRAEQEAAARARALGDRLTHDAFLGESVHRMLTRISAIRSASEILTDAPDLPPERAARFQAIVHDEAHALTDVAEALAAYFDRIDETERSLTPLDEVETLFEARGNRFPAIERAAAAIAPDAAGDGAGARLAAAARLAETALAEVVEAEIDRYGAIGTGAARARARRALMSYATDAILAPMARFAALATDLRYDVEALMGALALESDVVCRRLTALPPGPDAPRFGYFRANAAGTVIETRGLPALSAPRYAAACPLWALYRAQQSPGAIVRQRALFPNGLRFVFVARARAVGATGFGRPRHYLTDMATMSEADAQKTVYAPDPATPVEEVGPACRLCPRRACLHRVEDPLGE